MMDKVIAQNSCSKSQNKKREYNFTSKVLTHTLEKKKFLRTSNKGL